MSDSYILFNFVVLREFFASSDHSHLLNLVLNVVLLSSLHSLDSSSEDGISLTFKNVSFAYSKERPILHDVSFTIAPGTQAAIVGPSGSGKSTIFRLAAREFDVDGGGVFLSGVDVRQAKIRSVKNAIGVVPQDTCLFNDTIMNNIRYGRQSATEAEVRQAAELANLTATIERMPEGFATLVGERGLKLSGGEKQRIAIARLILKDPRIVFCDEATSALDMQTEHEIINNIRTFTKGRTAVYIAHRLSAITHCDDIIVLSHGHIAERGTHESLLALNGVYAAMWQYQSTTANAVGDPDDIEGHEHPDEAARVNEQAKADAAAALARAQPAVEAAIAFAQARAEAKAHAQREAEAAGMTRAQVLAAKARAAARVLAEARAAEAVARQAAEEEVLAEAKAQAEALARAHVTRKPVDEAEVAAAAAAALGHVHAQGQTLAQTETLSQMQTQTQADAADKEAGVRTRAEGNNSGSSAGREKGEKNAAKKD